MMMLELISPGELRDTLGLVPDTSGKTPTFRSLATMVRHCVGAWGACAPQRLSAHVLSRCEAAGFDREATVLALKEIVDVLSDVGDIARIRTDGNIHWAKAEPRVVVIDGRLAVLLGSVDESDSAALWLEAPDDPVRKVRYSVDNLAVGLRTESFADWLGIPSYQRYRGRRTGEDPFALSGDASRLWQAVSDALDADGLPAGSSESQFRILAGPAGDFFGRVSAPVPEGRWKESAKDGIWCAARPGHNTSHWHPAVVEVVAGRVVKALDLFDWDEWAWALLGRGIAGGEHEHATRTDTAVTFTFPLPVQIRRAMRLVAYQSSERSWAWVVPDEVPPVWLYWVEPITGT